MLKLYHTSTGKWSAAFEHQGFSFCGRKALVGSWRVNHDEAEADPSYLIKLIVSAVNLKGIDLPVVAANVAIKKS